MSEVMIVENEGGFYQTNKKCRECTHLGTPVTVETMRYKETIGEDNEGKEITASIALHVCPRCGSATKNVMNYAEIKHALIKK